MKVLLDTDIGTDIDDALCLAYLLAQPQCELMGITTVAGEAQNRAQMASVLCQLGGQPDVPIFPGAETPLVIEQRQKFAQQSSAVVNWPHEATFPVGEAVEFMRQTIRQNPHEITLLTVGPLTNIALLFKTDPEIPMLLKELVTMGGIFLNSPPPTEWNILLDPHAAAIVYNSPTPNHRSIGLDVTFQVQMTAADARVKFTGGILEPVREFAEIWFEQRPEVTFHDPLAAAVIFNDRICRFSTGRVEINLEEGELSGQTIWHPEDPQPIHQIATLVNPQAFFDEYFGLVNHFAV